MFRNPNTHSHVSDLIIGGSSTTTRVGQTCPEKSAWFLGILIDDLLSFSGHIDILKAKIKSALYALSTCNKIVPIKIRKTIYSSLFESHLRFGSISFGAASKKLLEPISVIQRKALRLVARASYNALSDVLFKHHNFLKYDNIIHLHQCIFMRQYSNKQLPASFTNMFKYLPLSQQVYRHHDYFFVPQIVNMPNLNFFPTIQMLRTWNCSNLCFGSEGEVLNKKKNL